LCTYLNENNDQVRYAKVLVTVAPWDKLKPLKIGLRSSEPFLIKGTPTVLNEVNEFSDFHFGKFRYKLFLVFTDIACTCLSGLGEPINCGVRQGVGARENRRRKGYGKREK